MHLRLCKLRDTNKQSIGNITMKTKTENKTKTFSTPTPIYSRGEVKESKSNRVKTSKGEANPIVVLPRPKFTKHECEREDDCQLCRDYINLIDFIRRKK